MKSMTYILIIAQLWGCFGKKPTLKTGHEGKTLPSMTLLLMDSSTHLDLKDVSSSQPIVLFYFSPICPYCRTLTNSLTEDIKKVSQLKIYMISSFPYEEIMKYYKEFKLNEYSNIIVGQDYQYSFSQYFKSPGVPCLAIYDRNKLLKEVLIGAVSPSLINDIALE
ncbi:TlpA family protein disulfide reductase [Niastella populi]|uniref:Thioredoxin-like fold domain-containing protein n=1 Tax=Niastella populi TaxID=550983 RepID=A0A1V9GAU2_9BACT|nr:thioredoxin fold domain-containing protein [Niastella populi]OQP67791.1 hypothetical protein A4R26_32865 [Niastella populi]